MSKDKGNFPTRHEMKVIVDGVQVGKTIESKNKDYIFEQRKIIRSKYDPYLVPCGKGRHTGVKEISTPKVEFKIASYQVIKCKKPRYKSFHNLPDWIEHYGVNAIDQYFAANEDYTKILRLREY